VPLASERTALTTDPATKAIVEKYLNAYPNELPNRVDFDIRALNTNSPQRIDEVNGLLRLDIPVTGKDKVFLSQSLQRQRIVAFQLVAGQNPNTEIHTMRSVATWQRAIDATTVMTLGASFSRSKSVLVSEPNAVGPRVRMGFQIEELGPDTMFPVDRAANTFRYGGGLQKTLGGGRHTLQLGGDLIRFQLNGIESGNLRGYFQFTNNFGRSAIENLRLGTPSIYEIALGELSRGYRTWTGSLYVADRWILHPRLQLYLGVRWTGEGAPTEVQNKDVIAYDSDMNNLSPRVSLAWEAGHGWIARAMYTTSFAQILPVTYQQVRNNPPGTRYVQVQNPSLADPLQGIDLSDPNARYVPTWLSPDLTSPYSHQYNAMLEKRAWMGSVSALGICGEPDDQAVELIYSESG
jgi:outer membrane receptor protein involved in Fe transport